MRLGLDATAHGRFQFFGRGLERPRRESAVAYRPGHGLLRVDLFEHTVRDIHDLRGSSVVDGQFGELPALGDVRLEDLLPGRGSRGISGLGCIADQRHPAIRYAPHQHSPRHFGELLGFVDDHVTVGPCPVAGSALCRGLALALIVALGELAGVDQVVRHQDLGIHLVLEILGCRAGEDVESALGVGDLRAPFTLCAFAFGGVVYTENLGQFVEQGSIGRTEAWSDALQKLVALGVVELRRCLGQPRRRRPQFREDLLRRQFGPELRDGGHDVRVLTHLVANVGDVVPTEE